MPTWAMARPKTQQANFARDPPIVQLNREKWILYLSLPRPACFEMRSFTDRLSGFAPDGPQHSAPSIFNIKLPQR